MDLFAGSEQRTFISFQLDSGTDGQPCRELEEAMDTRPVKLDVPDLFSSPFGGVITVYEFTAPAQSLLNQLLSKLISR